MAESKAKHALVLPSERSPAYRNWIGLLTDRFQKELPFEGPFHSVLTLGSGVSGALQAFDLHDTREIAFDEIGLPKGANTGHPKKVVVGLTQDGKKIAAFTGRTAAFEVDPDGIETESGHIQQMEAATAYLAMINGIGAENVFLTTACGGINHPLNDGEPKPFTKSDLPTLGVIGADLMLGYPNMYMGHYKGGAQNNFFALRDSDRYLMKAFTQSLEEVEPGIVIPPIYYASIPAVFEDVGLAHFLAINGVQAIGMTFGPEKTFLSGVTGIKRFLGIPIITDLVELCYEDYPNGGRPIPVDELRRHYSHEFILKDPSLDDEVRRVAALATDRLGRGLAHMIGRI